METTIELQCTRCNKPITRSAAEVKRCEQRGLSRVFCSNLCQRLYDCAEAYVDVVCTNCGKGCEKTKSQLAKSKTGSSFCSLSCAATWNNKLKKSSRRSKCEAMLCDILATEFPNLDIIANDKTLLDGLEADIAIPSLKIAIEWNGIVHFQPIYGDKQFARIQSVDLRKQTVAAERGIHLIVIADLKSTEQFVRKVAREIVPYLSNVIAKNSLGCSQDECAPNLLNSGLGIVNHSPATRHLSR